MGPREPCFAALLTLLGSSRRLVVVVFEDVHWADEATLDLLRYVGLWLDRATRCADRDLPRR